MNIIVYYTQNGTLYSSEGIKVAERPIEQFIKDSKSILCFFDLDHDVACLCKMLNLSPEKLHEIWHDGHTTSDGCFLSYFKQSSFSVFRGGNLKCVIANMQQYMPTKVLSEDEIFPKLAEAKVIAQSVYDSLVNLGLEPKILTSPIKSLQTKVLSKMNLPTVSDIPTEAGKMFYECTTGGWVECLRKGYFEKVYAWDIISAYASQLRKLIDFRGAEFKQVTDITDILEQPNTFGAFKVIVDTDAALHPLISKKRNLMLNGSFESTLRLEKIHWLYEHKLGTVKVLDGWIYSPVSDKKPLELMMDRLFARKVTGKGMDREIAKRLGTGVWGIMGQTLRDGEFGEFANSVWASEVETNIFTKVASFCLDNDFLPICITTDGVLTDKDLNIPSGAGMGEWKLTHSTEALVIGAGQAALKGKGKKSDFSLDFDDLMEKIKEKPDADTITLERGGYVTIGEVLRDKNFDQLGELKVDKREISITSDRKMCFIEEPTTFGELAKNQYTSIPWDSSFWEVIK